MQRDPGSLASGEYDLVVVGGGIYGACAAWEASLVGLKVALIEAADFGGETSRNSLRTLHGGLRHLQRLDFARMRESIRARREWLRLAPSLALPLRFVLPTYGHGLRGPQVMRLALGLNDLIGFDRNRGVTQDRRLPRGTVLSEQAARAAFDGTNNATCSGAASWYDAVCLDTERLLIAIVAAAARQGAHASNYVRATGLTVREGCVSSVQARDELSGAEFEIRTRAVVDSTGPWASGWTGGAGSGSAPRPLFRPSKAFNLVTRPFSFSDGMGFSVPVRQPGGVLERQTYFVIPWNGRALIGTRHLRCEPHSRSAVVTQGEVREFLEDINSVLGRHRVSGADVLGVFSGLLPETAGSAGGVALQRAPEITDHSPDGKRGVFSVVGVKWTTSITVAKDIVALACRYLGRGVRSPAKPQLTALDSAAAVARLIAHDPTLSRTVVPDLPVVRGQIVQAVREEMAVQLADVVMGRTPLYLSPMFDETALAACASIAARELRWSQRETAIQIGRAWELVGKFRKPWNDTHHERTTPDFRPAALAPGPSGFREGPSLAAADVP